MIAPESGTSINAYYIKGESAPKIQTIGLNTDPLVALKQYQVGNTNTPGQSIPASFPSNVSLKGNIDPTIVGVWKSDDDDKTKTSYYKFNADGTAEFYANAAAYAGGMKKKCQWRVDGNFMEFIYEGETKTQRLEIHKGHGCHFDDNLSCLAINGEIYLRADGKKVAW